MKELIVTVETLSPLHLGNGKANIIIDAEIVHDEYGMPYFPAKRLKGLLYESALELFEMSNGSLFEYEDLEKLFGHADDGEAGFKLNNLYLPDYFEKRREWEYLFGKYHGLFNRFNVLDTYTSLRYQTQIDPDTGVAKDGTLHNMRLIDAGIIFSGTLELFSDNEADFKILVMAAKNLRFAGYKRNRGNGRIKCMLTEKKN